MPDMKYSDEKTAEQLSGIKDYPSINKAAIKEMHRQVGDLQMDDEGVAYRGLLVRHLVLPNRLAGTQEVVRFLAREVSTDSYLNVHRLLEFFHEACGYGSGYGYIIKLHIPSGCNSPYSHLLASRC